MKKSHVVMLVAAILIIPIGVGLYSIGMFKFFAPLHRDVERKVFENTKSYTHGIQQDLGKYYGEYQAADDAGKAAIKATILIRFAEVDGSKLQNPQLRQFLTEMRGY